MKEAEQRHDVWIPTNSIKSCLTTQSQYNTVALKSIIGRDSVVLCLGNSFSLKQHSLPEQTAGARSRLRSLSSAQERQQLDVQLSLLAETRAPQRRTKWDLCNSATEVHTSHSSSPLALSVAPDDVFHGPHTSWKQFIMTRSSRCP